MTSSARRLLRRAIYSRLPRPFSEWLLRHRQMRTWSTFAAAGLAYIHVPRAAGTSVSHELYGTWIEHHTLRDLLEVLPEDFAAMKRFTIVRNPWDRLLSAWSLARAGQGHDGRVFVNNPEHYQVAEAATFERFVLEWLPSRKLERLDPLFRPQCSFIENTAGEIVYDHVGRFEDMTATEQWLSQQLGRQLRLPQYNQSRHPPYPECYTPEMRRIVAQIYAEDIERLGYSF